MTDIGGRRIARNTIFIIGALVGQKVLSFIYFTIVARVMGVEDTGRYFLAVSFGLLFSVLADLGLAPFLVRESTKLREGVATQLRSILGVKVLLLVLAFVGMNGIAFITPYPSITRQLIFLVSISILFESSNLTLYSILRGWQRLEFESIGIIAGQAISLCFGVATLFLFHSLHLLVVGLILGNAANFLWAIMLMRRFHIPLAFSFSQSGLRQTFVAIIPFALAAVFTRVTGFVDSFLLSILGTETMVGLYSVPFKVTFALQFIPLGFAASLLPAMSALAEHDKKALARTFVKSSLYLFFIALPVAFGIAGLADRIIPEVFGAAYQDSVRAQRLLVLSLIFIFCNFPIGSFLVAVRRQSLNTTLLGVAMLTNIIVNVLLIPRFGIMGPAVASLVANALLFSLGFFFVARSIALPYDDILHGLAKALVAGSVMVATVMATKTLLPLLLVIAAGAIVYGACLLLLRAVTIDEFRQMIISLKYAKDTSPDTGVSS